MALDRRPATAISTFASASVRPGPSPAAPPPNRLAPAKPETTPPQPEHTNCPHLLVQREPQRPKIAEASRAALAAVSPMVLSDTRDHASTARRAAEQRGADRGMSLSSLRVAQICVVQSSYRCPAECACRAQRQIQSGSRRNVCTGIPAPGTGTQRSSAVTARTATALPPWSRPACPKGRRAPHQIADGDPLQHAVDAQVVKVKKREA